MHPIQKITLKFFLNYKWPYVLFMFVSATILFIYRAELSFGSSTLGTIILVTSIGAIFSAVSLAAIPTQMAREAFPEIRNKPSFKPVGVNELCPCGSGMMERLHELGKLCRRSTKFLVVRLSAISDRSVREASMQIKKLQEVRENWFQWIAILVGAATFIISVILFVDVTLLRHQVKTTRLEQIGTAWLLCGAFWTALGGILNKKKRLALDAMANQGVLDVKEIVRIFKAASNFSTIGAFMIGLGTVVLLYKMYLH